MKSGDVVLHKSWGDTPVLLLSKHEMDEPPRIYWEVLVDGDLELIKDSEIKKDNESR